MVCEVSESNSELRNSLQILSLISLIQPASDSRMAARWNMKSQGGCEVMKDLEGW